MRGRPNASKMRKGKVCTKCGMNSFDAWARKLPPLPYGPCEPKEEPPDAA